MSRITEKLKELRNRNQAALIPYIMAGDPDMDLTEKLIFEIEKSGADMLELGVPFSDPLADGPTIQRAAMKALAAGVDIKKVLGLVKRIRAKSGMPVILMLYYNLVFKYGEEKFVKDAARSGVDGVIIPDLPPDEAGSLMTHARAAGLDVIFLLAPTSDTGRVRLVERSSSGFIYYVSLTGVTGARASLDKGIKSQLDVIRRATDKPVCVGFGISRPEQASLVASWADGVIVGSAIVAIIDKAGSPAAACRDVGRFVRGLKKSMLSSR